MGKNGREGHEILDLGNFSVLFGKIYHTKYSRMQSSYQWFVCTKKVYQNDLCKMGIVCVNYTPRSLRVRPSKMDGKTSLSFWVPVTFAEVNLLLNFN